MICNNLSINEKGHLCIGGQDTVELAKIYGTPLYLFDEDRIRERCRTYRTALKEAFGESANALYASKAASFRGMYRIMKEEGMGVDVVSSGEIYTALSAGYPLENAYFIGVFKGSLKASNPSLSAKTPPMVVFCCKYNYISAQRVVFLCQFCRLSSI